MKRMHLHVSVPDLAQSIDFYATIASLDRLSLQRRLDEIGQRREAAQKA